MKKNTILFFILLLGFILRIYDINWDQGHHLHPDERFLTMVAMAERIPLSLADYFSPQKSSLNPYNVGYPFFVYGSWPLTLTKIAAVLTGLDNYRDFTLLGRFLSAVADTLTIVVIYKIVALWEKKYHWDGKIKFLAGFFYAFSVLPIQLAHFFAVDSFLSFFMLAAFYFGLNFTWRRLVLNGVFFGLALGTKISAVYILPLILFFLAFPFLPKKQWWLAMKAIGLFIILSYLTLRLADPKFFASANLFNPGPNPQFVRNLKELAYFSGKEAWYPPAVQWLSKKPVIFPLTNLAFFGLGLPYFLLMLAGGYFLWRGKKLELNIIMGWLVVFFIYQSFQFATTMRYFIFLYPFFAIFAGWGLVKIQFQQILSLASPKKYRMPHFLGLPVSRHLLKLLLILLVVIWPISFMHIYTQKNSRVAASEWVVKNISRDAFLAEEHWDDFLPVGGENYQGEQMPVFDPDTDEKWVKINDALRKADYFILTSNRGYGSIMTVPERYPKMAAFYQNLFAGRLKFKKIKEFTSYPILNLGVVKLELKDDWAEESFTVYDHPKVIIFKKISS